MKSLRTLAFLSAVACVAAAHAQLGVAGNFNDYVLGNSTQSNVDAGGLYAVGGNANFTNMTVNSANASLYSGYAVIAGGSYTNSNATITGGVYAGTTLTTSDPTVNGNLAGSSISLSGYGTVGGSVMYGSSYSNPNTKINGSVQQGTAAAPINFASTNAYITGYSAFLGSQSTTVGALVNRSNSTLTLTGSNATLDVFNVTAAQLSGQNTLVISAPSTATVLVNFAGTSDTLTGGVSFQGGAVEDHVLYNFANATSLTISGFGGNGSVLAPTAAVNFSGQLDGNLIAGSLTGGGETHNDLFDGGGLPPTPSPEPMTLAIPVVLAGAWLRRRAKAARA